MKTTRLRPLGLTLIALHLIVIISITRDVIVSGTTHPFSDACLVTINMNGLTWFLRMQIAHWRRDRKERGE